MNRQFNEGDILFLLWGLQWTVVLSLIAFVGGGVLGLIIAVMRTSRVKVLRYAAIGYIRVFQGTPLLIQLFIFFFLPALYGIRVAPILAAACGLSLHAGAYLGDIWRGSIQAVPRGQWDAATALGMSRALRLRLVILPQAVRSAIPPTVGYLVQLIKDTSLASTIGFLELSFSGHLIVNATYRPFFIYLLVAAGYFMICFPLAQASRALERRLDYAN